MRNLVVALALLNLAFFAYAVWIDQPVVPGADSAPELPRLLLASEFPPPQKGNEPAAADAEAATPAGEAANISQATPGSAACVAVGPFDDTSTAARAAAVLKGRGFDPRQRREAGEITDGYWVHVENIASVAEQTRVMRTLEQAGLSDAAPVQSADQVRHISVGIFTDSARAERRASAVKRLGVEAQVTPRKRAGTVYWLELQPKADTGTVSTDGIASDGERIEVKACNAVLASAPTARR